MAAAQTSPPRAILIAGPTASGKSEAALALATRLGGTVINADSMQVYRELAVLTARPEPEELAQAPHRLYGTIPAAEAYSVGRWLEDAAASIAEAKRGGRVPILVGGTGLYFKALLEGLSPIPDIPSETRVFWREQSEGLGPEGLYRELRTRDPVMAARLRASDPQRVVRALEVIEATGVSLAEWQETAGAPVLYRRPCSSSSSPRNASRSMRPDARFDRMIERGALDEVRALVILHLDSGLPAMRAHGVRSSAPTWRAPRPKRRSSRRRPRRALRQAADDLAETVHGGLGVGPDGGAAVHAATARYVTR